MPAVVIQLELQGDQTVIRQANQVGAAINKSFNPYGATGLGLDKSILGLQAFGKEASTQSSVLEGLGLKARKSFNPYGATGLGLDKSIDGLKKFGSTSNAVFGGLTNIQEKGIRGGELLAATIGFQLPRAAVKAIASNKLLAGSFAAAFDATVVLAVVGAVASLIPEAAHVIDKLRGINEELDKQKTLALAISKISLGPQNVSDLSKQFASLAKERRDAEATMRNESHFLGSPVTGFVKVPPLFPSDEYKAARERLKELKQILGEDMPVAIAQTEKADEQLAATHGRVVAEALATTKTGFAQITAVENAAIEEAKALEQSRVISHQDATDRIAEAEVKANAARVVAFRDLQVKLREMRGTAKTLVLQDADDTGKKLDVVLQDQLANEQRANDKELGYLTALSDANTNYEVARREMNGDAIGAIILQENARVEQQLRGLREMGANEQQLANARVALQREADVHIAQEFRSAVQDMGGQLESLADDIGGGKIGSRILSNLKKMLAQMVAQWLLATNAMRGTFGNVLGGLVFGPGSSASQFFGGAQGGPIAGASQLGGIGGLLGLGGGQGGFAGGIPLPGLNGISNGSGGIGGILGTAGIGGNTIGLSSTSNPGAGTQAAALQTILGGGSVPILTTTRASATGLSSILSKGSLATILPIIGALAAGKAGGTAASLGAGIGGTVIAGGLGFGPLGSSSLLLNPIFGTVAGAAAGGLLGFGVGQQHGPVAGGISGGALGALIPLLLGLGPVGIVIGGIVGLLGGLFGGFLGGSKRRGQANQFASDQQSEINKVVAAFEGFQLDYPTAIAQLEDMRKNSQQQLNQLKGEGRDVFAKRVGPAIDAAEAALKGDQGERTRRATLLFGPAAFASGGYTGDMPANQVAGIVHGREYVMNAAATTKWRSQLEAMNRGASPRSGGGDVHFHGDLNFQATTLDRAWLRNGGNVEIADAIALGIREGRIKVA
jgi:hypothetical protein